VTSGAAASVIYTSIRLVEVEVWLKPFADYWRGRMQALDIILEKDDP
jgi:hypothetical protein